MPPINFEKNSALTPLPTFVRCESSAFDNAKQIPTHQGRSISNPYDERILWKLIFFSVYSNCTMSWHKGHKLAKIGIAGSFEATPLTSFFHSCSMCWVNKCCVKRINCKWVSVFTALLIANIASGIPLPLSCHDMTVLAQQQVACVAVGSLKYIGEVNLNS